MDTARADQRTVEREVTNRRSSRCLDHSLKTLDGYTHVLEVEQSADSVLYSTWLEGVMAKVI